MRWEEEEMREGVQLGRDRKEDLKEAKGVAGRYGKK